jgi:hypothetical protein
MDRWAGLRAISSFFLSFPRKVFQHSLILMF